MTPTVTERDAVLRERKAAARMRCMVLHELHYDDEAREYPCINCERRATELHPLPKITRPRVVIDPNLGVSCSVEWRVADGVVHVRGGVREWRTYPRHGTFESQDYRPTAERVALWADLLANPTEEVEESP